MRVLLSSVLLVFAQALLPGHVAASEAKTTAETPAAEVDSQASAAPIVEGAAEEASAPPPAPKAPWLAPRVLKAAVAIDMTPEQMPGFRAAVTDLVNNRTKAVNRVIRGNNVSNLKRKLRVANQRQFKKMDKSMAALLTAEQYPKYEVYRDLLSDEMKAATRRRSGGNSDSMGVTNAALNGFSDSN